MVLNLNVNNLLIIVGSIFLLFVIIYPIFLKLVQHKKIDGYLFFVIILIAISIICNIIFMARYASKFYYYVDEPLQRFYKANTLEESRFYLNNVTSYLRNNNLTTGTTAIFYDSYSSNIETWFNKLEAVEEVLNILYEEKYEKRTNLDKILKDEQELDKERIWEKVFQKLGPSYYYIIINNKIGYLYIEYPSFMTIVHPDTKYLDFSWKFGSMLLMFYYLVLLAIFRSPPNVKPPTLY